MEQAGDVRRVVEIEEIQPGTWLYLVETPFETFPRFVVGRFFEADDTAWPWGRCGMEAGGRQLFAEARAKFGVGDHGRSYHVTVLHDGGAR